MIIRILRIQFSCKSLKAAYDFRWVPWRFCNIRQPPASFALHSPALICFPQMLIPQYKTLIFSTAAIDQSERSHVSLPLLILAPAIWGLDLTEEVSADSPVAPTRPELQIQINPTFISPILAPWRGSENTGVDWQRVLSVTHSSASGVS